MTFSNLESKKNPKILEEISKAEKTSNAGQCNYSTAPADNKINELMGRPASSPLPL